MSVNCKVHTAKFVISWDYEGDPKGIEQKNYCKLCKKPLLTPPPQEYQINEKINGIKISRRLIKGECGDIFHDKCIKNSLNLKNISCPNCNTIWKYSKVLKTGIINDEKYEKILVKNAY